MKSKLGKAVLIAAGALAVAGISAPAYAEVAAGGGGGFVATADEPAICWSQGGWGATDDIFAWGHSGGCATDDSIIQGGGGGAVID